MSKLARKALAPTSDHVRPDNIEHLKALFPEAVADGLIDFEVLRQLLSGVTDDREEKYGLNWYGKRRARQVALTPSVGTLLPCPEDSVDWENTGNLLVEGDNLEVLKLLQKSYSGKVKLIYIDPPYNTGRDFVYPDRHDDSLSTYLRYTGQVNDEGFKTSTNADTSGRFHTNWLNMMYPRLKLARHLMSEDGLIFISIDDNEVANARKVCDEIFGEENFIDCMVWKKRYGGGAKEKYLVTLHEYILVYAKSLGTIGRIEVPLSEASIERYYILRDEHFEERGPYRTHPLEAMKSFEDRPNLRFAITAPDGTKLFPKRQWRWGPERMEEALARGEVAFTQDKTGAWSASSKQYLKLADDSGDNRSAKAFSIIDGIYTQAGTAETVEMFGDARVFSFPKPTALIQRLVEIATSNQKDALVLDFFAGSGTTGHAVMAQNAVDGGTRRFVLVQLPEPLSIGHKDQDAAAKFCGKIGKPRTLTELTKERLRRAGKKVREEKPKSAGDLGFRVFKLAASNIRAWEPDLENLPRSLLESVDHLLSDRTETDILYELLLKLGVDLCVEIERRKISAKDVHSIGGGVLLVCLAKKITREQVKPLAEGIVKWRKELAPAGDTTCVFRDSAFADDVAKTNLAAILNQHGLVNVRHL
jgi:adenine-specific DNA-methyltransferase